MLCWHAIDSIKKASLNKLRIVGLLNLFLLWNKEGQSNRSWEPFSVMRYFFWKFGRFWGKEEFSQLFLDPRIHYWSLKLPPLDTVLNSVRLKMHPLYLQFSSQIHPPLNCLHSPNLLPYIFPTLDSLISYIVLMTPFLRLPGYIFITVSHIKTLVMCSASNDIR